MKTHLRARGLLAGAVAVLAVTGGTGVAHADPDPVLPPAPGIITQLVTSTPALSPDTADEDGPAMGSDAVGMFCENQFAHCR